MFHFGFTQTRHASVQGYAKWQVHAFICYLCCMELIYGTVRYSIPEEMRKGAFVGNLSRDLGLDVKRLKSGNARIVTTDPVHYTELDTEKGILVVNERIDREGLCRLTSPCTISFEIILENPLELHRVNVEIVDINDNSPSFPKKEIHLQVSELALSGARFLLENAADPDVGINSLQSYTLSPNDNFVLKQHSRADGSKYVEMVLQTPVDREKQDEINLELTAFDGGKPQKSGTVKIIVIVLDANDNPPIFSERVYRASVQENALKGTQVTTVHASDTDVGVNGEVTYSITHVTGSSGDLFHLDSQTGKIIVWGEIDYENTRLLEIDIEAKDYGGLTDSCKVIVEVTDVNDNVPVITVMSLSNSVSEDAVPGTSIGIINVKDFDSGKNGEVQCFINPGLPFKIQSSLTNYFTLLTGDNLDRESVSKYNITITAKDAGLPSLSASIAITLEISDVNDNSPIFEKQSYSASLMENNTPGMSIISILAKDADWERNARITYRLGESSASSYVSINSDTGVVYAVQSFDYEQMKDFEFSVVAQDAGLSPRSSQVTVKLIVQDENDNSPQILYPKENEGRTMAEMISRQADVGYLVTKIVAVDADSGSNAWLSYKLLKATDRTIFAVDLNNGEIRTARQILESDHMKHKLSVVVQDNGEPSRSAIVNINVAVADSFNELNSAFNDTLQDKDNENITFYLIIALVAVCSIFLITIIGFVVFKFCRHGYFPSFLESSKPNVHCTPRSFYPPRYADVGATGTLQHVYNYEVCLTTDSRASDFKYVRPCSQNTLRLHSAATETLRHGEKEILQNESMGTSIGVQAGEVTCSWNREANPQSSTVSLLQCQSTTSRSEVLSLNHCATH
uniref:Protocadherin 1 gamma 13 n=1 Tax=Erpetoichthys calabaricus TaxID=27687 RepID=A0A8C4SG84_ERPCA